MKSTNFLAALVVGTSFLIPGQIWNATCAAPEIEAGSAAEKTAPYQADSQEKVTGPLGSKTNPVRCQDPSGERQYLNRLRCADGKRPVYSRIGSFAAGPYGNILDGYRVKCENNEEVTVFMDMYHKGYIEKEAVPGFTIVDE